jgi:ABC-2 family transporter protein
MKNTNALVAKEIRLLLPAYIAALVLAILPVWLLPNVPYRNSIAGVSFIVFCAFGFGIVMLALSSFGREFGMNTFPLMLAQPLQRNRVWWTKAVILACAIASIYYAWVSSWNARDVDVEYAETSSTWFEMLSSGGFAAVAIFAGGLFATLLLRQVAAAFWFTVFVPLAMGTVLESLGTPGWLVNTTLAAYAVSAFIGAWWLFYRAQEVGWTGGTIALLGWRSEDVARPGNRSRRPFSALFWKEIQLQQVGLLGIGGLFLLHLGAVLWRKHGGRSLNDTLKTGLDVFGGMWFLVPLLIGGTSVAEERKLGTMQSHLTLPVSRKIQFTIKLLTVLLIGGLLCAVLLWTAEGIGSALGASCGVEILKTPFTTEALSELCWLFLACSLVSFFASTLVSGLIQSFAASVLAGTVLWLSAGLIMWLAAALADKFGFILVSVYLLRLVSLRTVAVTILCLSYCNFKTVSESWQLWRRNLLTFLCVWLGIVAITSSVYNRAWEFLMPEPAHGPARISAANPPRLESLNSEGSQMNVLMPDGNIWENSVDRVEGRIWLGFPTGGRWVTQPGNHFLSGSNWRDAFSSFRETVAIHGDGTLWVSEKPSLTWHFENGKRVLERLKPFPLVQYGTETNWQRVVPSGWGATVVLLKQDGSLWHWRPTTEQTKEDEAKHRPWPGLRAFELHQLGTETNWNRLIAQGGGIHAWKDNGQHWLAINTDKKAQPPEVELEPGKVMVRDPNLDNFKFKSLATGWNFEAGLDEDGRLWTWTGQRQQPVRIGTDSDWSSLACDNGRLVARKADGSLWQWVFDDRSWMWQAHGYTMSAQDLVNIIPTRLDGHNDWLAVGNDPWSGVVALAADGSLWQWWDRSFGYQAYGPDGLSLSPSRRPSLIANIFDN